MIKINFKQLSSKLLKIKVVTSGCGTRRTHQTKRLL
ncbi:TQQ cross-linked RaS-RiPP peptide [Streptococcus sciuri]